MTIRIVLAGCGNMGFAMLKGWLEQAAAEPSAVGVVEPDEALRARAAALGVEAAADPERFSDSRAELVVLAVKPQVIRAVAAGYRPLAAAGASVLSIAAGTPIAALRDVLDGAPAMRAMPNLPAAVGKGVIGLYAPADVPASARSLAERLLGANGSLIRLDSEAMIDAVTAVSGSGPGYVFHFVEALAAAAVRLGFPEADALVLARDTVWGAGALVHETGESPTVLRRQVTSVGGTTAAGLNVLMRGDALTRLMTETVDAALARARELAAD